MRGGNPYRVVLFLSYRQYTGTPSGFLPQYVALGRSMARTAMKDERSHKFQKPCIDLIEEATQALRSAPAETLAIYYSGAIPFILGFLYFWTDMTQSPYANQHLAEASLGVALLFVWMKFCQALFAARLRAQLAADEMPRYTLNEYGWIFFAQAVIQPIGLLIIPLALLLALPFGWVYAFYQNVTALASPEGRSASSLARRAWGQATLWPGQNHAMLGIATLFGGCVFLNWGVVALAIPDLLKMLFGIETVFTQARAAMLNTTLFVSVCGLTYLTMDPLVKAVYVLRCFYGESIQSGEDLKSDLRRFATALRGFAVTIITIVLMGAEASAAMQSSSAPVPNELDRRIDEVIHRDKFAWRMSRDGTVDKSNDSVITAFLHRVWIMLRDVLRDVLTWIDRFLRSLFRNSSNGITHGFSWSSSSLLLYGLLAVVLATLAVVVYRLLRARDVQTILADVSPLRPTPDIADERVGADQLPADGWASMARDLFDRGEFRLAMRAFYLASLAHLAQRNLVSIARFKSNRDYENELQRRGHAIPELLPVFTDNVSALERIWYGMHEVNVDAVRRFASNVDKIRSGV
jgi:hypothetical protein